MTTSGWWVKYDGVCSRCGIALRAGEVAVYDRPTRTIHCVVCPAVEATDEALVETPGPAVIAPGVAGASARRESSAGRLPERIVPAPALARARSVGRNLSRAALGRHRRAAVHALIRVLEAVT